MLTMSKKRKWGMFRLGRRSKAAVVALGVIIVGAFAPGAGMAAAPRQPVVRIPELAKPPVLNGYITPTHVTGGWQNAARITGLQDYILQALPPSKLAATWWLAYGKKHLYLASYFPAYPKGTIVATVKHGDDGGQNPGANGILRDDHVEIQICNLPKRSEAITKYFYKIMTNPYAAVVDQQIEWSVGWMGFEWQSGAKVRCRTTKNGWSMEMAIPLKGLGHPVAPPNGTRWFMQLASAQGEFHYYAWQPVSYLDWDKMPSIIFDSDTPVVQITGLGHVQHGQVNVGARIVVPKGKKPVRVRVRVIGFHGQRLYSQTTSVAAGEKVRTLHFIKNGLPTGGRGQTLQILAVQGSKVLYRDAMRMDTLTPGRLRALFTSIAMRRHGLGQPTMSSCYYQSYRILTARCDVNIMEVKPAIRAAKVLRASIMRLGQPDPVREAAGSIQSNGVGYVQMATGKLAPGKYQVVLQIIGQKGKALATHVDPFEVRHFPWEHNKIGEEHVVVPPYTPVQVRGNTVHLWDRAFHFAATGLPDSLVSLHRNMLAKPITLNARVNGKMQVLTAIAAAHWQSDHGYSSTVTGRDHLGANLGVKVQAKTEYDGTTFYTLHLQPHGSCIVDNLRLLIPLHHLPDWAAMRSSNRYIPHGNVSVRMPDGPFWNSGDMSAAAFMHDTFLPYCVVSNGQRALAWTAVSDQGWRVSGNKPTFILEKHGHKQIWMRVTFIDSPSALTGSDTIRFMLTAMPLKPKPADWRYRMWGMPNARFGWQGSCLWAYGTGPTISFYKQSQYNILEKVLSEQRQQCRRAALHTAGPKFAPLTCWYVSASTWGYAMPEYATYSGEWTGMTHPPMDPQQAYINFKNPWGTWTTPRQETRGACDLIPSMIDCRVYYYDQMQKHGGINGFWWDNSSFWTSGSLIKGTAYRKHNGQVHGIYNILLMREMLKRMAVVAEHNKVTDFQGIYAQGAVAPIAAFANWLWAVEGPWYVNSNKLDLVDNIRGGLNGVRTLLQTYEGLPISMDNNTQDQNPKYNSDPWQTRSCLGVALLFDVGDGWNGGLNYLCQQRVEHALSRFGYFDHRVKWVPYWRTRRLVQASGGRIVTTLYVRKIAGEPPAVMLVMFNDGNGAATVRLKADTMKLLGLTGSETTLHDLEQSGAKSVPMIGKFWGGIRIRRHDFRLMVLAPAATNK